VYRHRCSIGIDVCNYLTTKSSVQAQDLDIRKSYRVLGNPDYLRRPVHWVSHQIRQQNILVVKPKYEHDLPIRESQTSFRIHHPDLNRRPFSFYQFSLFNLSPDCPWVTDPISPINLKTAWRKRLASVRPPINNIYLAEAERITNILLQQNFEPLPFLENDQDFLFQTWLDENKSYSGPRKRQLMRAYKTLSEIRINEHDYACKTHVKREMYEEPKYLRLINSRTDRFKALVGPYIHYLEKLIYHKKIRYQGGEHQFFVKGTDPHLFPTLISKLQDNPYFLETDYSSFESSFDPCYVDVVECSLWRYFFKNNPTILKTIMNVYYTNHHGALVPRKEKLLSKLFSAGVTGARMEKCGPHLQMVFRILLIY